MSSEDRRQALLDRLTLASAPLSATVLAGEFGVSRQVIVQDVALLRAKGVAVESLARGYLLTKKSPVQRIFKVIHTDDEVETELNLIVDAGGTVADVFVFHKYYGTVRADMDIRSRLDVRRFLSDIASGKSGLLKNVTAGYHYHTVTADREDSLDHIEQGLRERGFLAPLQEYEPSGVRDLVSDS
ncbi:MAG: transcription repressor NadR [Clostridia bacterium]|nr:transcription repressor NadR [Clostridia bacterium]MBQ4323357.1 transcription repressor NadR [Clostridia bacterium]